MCCKDLWYLEVDKPSAPSRVSLVKAGTHSLEVSWNGSPSVQTYILQIQKYNLPPTTKTSGSGKVASPETCAAIIKANPIMAVTQPVMNSGQTTQVQVAKVASQGAVPKLLSPSVGKGRLFKVKHIFLIVSQFMKYCKITLLIDSNFNRLNIILTILIAILTFRVLSY